MGPPALPPIERPTRSKRPIPNTPKKVKVNPIKVNNLPGGRMPKKPKTVSGKCNVWESNDDKAFRKNKGLRKTVSKEYYKTSVVTHIVDSTRTVHLDLYTSG